MESNGSTKSGVIKNDSHKENEKKMDTKVCLNENILRRSSSNSHDPLRHLTASFSRPKILICPNRRLSDFMHIEYYENGGGYALHSYADELAHLSPDDLKVFVQKYFKTLFTERQKRGISVKFSYYCIGVVHGAAKRFPELLSYFSNAYPSLAVTTNSFENKNASESISLSNYANNVYKSYSRGTYRFGPLHAISIVGIKGEERGCFSEDVINLIESDPFLRVVTPWGSLSKLSGMDPHLSNDGPILWARHGEQCVPVGQSSPVHKSRTSNGAQLTELLHTRRTRKGRQVLVPDRTPCHADHADDGLGRHTTAAIGFLKAIHPQSVPTGRSTASINPTRASAASSTDAASCTPIVPEFQQNSGLNCYSYEQYTPGRIVKDVVVFDPRHYADLVKRLRLDIMEPPMSQCGSFWADDGELNQLRVEGYRYVRLPLRDNDIYFIPRNVVHQFKTVSATVSVAWHVRLKRYYDDEPCDSSMTNLATGTKQEEQLASTHIVSPSCTEFSSNEAQHSTGDHVPGSKNGTDVESLSEKTAFEVGIVSG